MVYEPAVVLAALVFLATGYSLWMYHIIQTQEMSGDKWYIRQFAFTDKPISAPYCWRPLLPWMARVVGFRPVSLAANAAVPFVVYYYVGGGWTGFCCSMMYLMTPHLFIFNAKNPEYAESLGHLVFALTIVAMSTGHWSAYPLAVACALTRETISAAVGAICLFVNPWLLIPLAAGTAVALVSRKECKDNQHPLVEKTCYETFARWSKHKGWKSVTFAHTLLPLRGIAFAVPIMWDRVGDFSRLGLVGLIPIWILAIPATGQSRIMCYGFILFIPFIAQIPQPWLWVVTGIVCFWPIDWNSYDECGDTKFAYIGKTRR